MEQSKEQYFILPNQSFVGLGTEFDSYHYPFADAGIVLNEIK